MSCIYFRVQHYVASYIRNRDPRNRIEAGELLSKGNIESFMHVISNGLFLNDDERVMKNGCFCERQWNKMLKGYSLYTTTKRPLPLMVPKAPGTLLDDAEIRLLAGVDYGNGGNDGEYLRIPLPEEVILPDGVHKVNKNFQLNNSAAKSLRMQMNLDFKRALFDFIGKEQAYVHSEHVNRTIQEMLERFMACYDIRNGLNNQERDALKRNYYRWRGTRDGGEDYYVNHGSL